MISWQALGAYVDLGTYYVFGVPAAAALGFLFKLREPAPWIGLQAGAFLKTILLFIITNRTNWENRSTLLSPLKRLDVAVLNQHSHLLCSNGTSI